MSMPKYAKFFKILMISFCIFYFIGWIFNIRSSNTIYLSNKKVRNFLPVQWPTLFNVSENKTKSLINFKFTIQIDEETKSDNISKVKIFGINYNRLKNKMKTSQQKYGNVLKTFGLNNDILPCPEKPPGLVGPIEINITSLPLNYVDNINFGNDIGGHFKPHHCIPKDKVAIIIPYRHRDVHLAIFLNNMHTFLMKQEIEYQIFVIEQNGNDIFNRAILKNIGYNQAKKLKEWDCYIFHDVDLIPLDDRNLYNCPEQPRHHSAAIDKFNFALPYDELSGGVLALTSEQFQTVNGFSNSFWGWGGEDDDMSNRLKHHKYTLTRYPMNIARYTMLDHVEDYPNPDRFRNLDIGKRQFNEDGLNNLQYTVIEMKIYNLYTYYLIEINTPNYSYDVLTGLLNLFLTGVKS